MNQLINRWLVVVGFVAIAVSALSGQASAQQVNVEAAKKEGKVVVYGSVPPQAMKGFHDAFESKYGIKVEYWRGDSTKVADRAQSEWRAGKPAFDVVEANRGVQLIMKEERLLQKFLPPSAESFPAKFKEKDGLITP
ncbi:MAG: hypothetical protein U1E51_33445, partial [Candidatus Binatia bacterium]|nr:hypothetical protein [Candidatus Binatia bacterium]